MTTLYTIIKLIFQTAIFTIILKTFNQKRFAQLILLCGFLTLVHTTLPLIRSAESKAHDVRKDVQQLTQAIDKVGTGINKIGVTKQNIDNAVEKTKIPGLDTADKRIEEWWQKVFDIIGGKSE